MLDYSKLPEWAQDGMRLYMEAGIPPGSGLEAVLSNELVETVGRVFDGWNGHEIMMLASWLYNEAPGRDAGAPWGSRKAVRDWLARDWSVARAALQKGAQ